jgi:hypothetical protein
VPLGLRMVAGALLVLVGVTLLTVGVLGQRSRLPRNRWIGIRTRATLSSSAAFARAHRVAAAPATAAGTIALIGAAVLLVGADGPVDWIVLGVSGVGTLGLGTFAGLVGDRAAALVRPEPAATCAGSCAGCDLVAGCRDQPTGQESPVPPEPASPSGS